MGEDEGGNKDVERGLAAAVQLGAELVVGARDDRAQRQRDEIAAALPPRKTPPAHWDRLESKQGGALAFAYAGILVTSRLSTMNVEEDGGAPQARTGWLIVVSRHRGGGRAADNDCTRAIRAFDMVGCSPVDLPETEPRCFFKPFPTEEVVRAE